MEHSIRWGILSTGAIAADVAAALSEIPDATIVAVGSRNIDNANAFADRFSIPNRHASYHALANDPEVDVVYVATPHVRHAENCLLCLHAGKPVLCEKPFTLNAVEAEDVIRIARERHLFLMEAMCTRHMPIVREAKRLIDEGAIGQVRMMHGDFGVHANLGAKHRLMNPHLGGGVLLDLGIYPISIASFFLGPIESVASSAYIGASGVDYQVAVSMRHRDGSLATVSASLEAESPLEVIVMGTKGRIHLHQHAYKGDSLTLVQENCDSRHIRIEFDRNGYQFELEHVMQCLRAGRVESDVMPLNETLMLMRTMDRIRAQIGLRYPGEA